MTQQEDRLTCEELLAAWPVFSDEDRAESLRLLPREDAEELFQSLDAPSQADLLLCIRPSEQPGLIRILAPDDAADVIQSTPAEQKETLLALLDERTRVEVNALLAYAEDDAGGLMNPRFARLRPEMSADEAIAYLRRQTRESVESIYYGYVLDSQQRLLGVVSLRELVTAAPQRIVRDMMRTDEIITAREDMDQEQLGNLFAHHDLTIIPILDEDGRMKGVVTVDDIVDVVREEATEDIQKVGGMEALETPYLQAGFGEMIRKRVGWLMILFVAGSLTATAMAFYEDVLSHAVVLGFFLPLIVSSGGNSGSQASTLVIRAMALGEVQLRDWWRILRRELLQGLTLGLILAVIAILRVVLWEWGWRGIYDKSLYTDYYFLVAITVAVSVLAIVLWGTIVGSMLPFILRRAGLDPASASAPFVATLVDVTGILIYFGAASVLLRGALL